MSNVKWIKACRVGCLGRIDDVVTELSRDWVKGETEKEKDNSRNRAEWEREGGMGGVTGTKRKE